MLFFLIPRIRRRRATYRNCPRKTKPQLPPPPTNKKPALAAAGGTLTLMTTLIAAALAYRHLINPTTGYTLATIGIITTIALLIQAAQAPLEPPTGTTEGPINPRMYYSNRR